MLNLGLERYVIRITGLNVLWFLQLYYMHTVCTLLSPSFHVGWMLKWYLLVVLLGWGLKTKRSSYLVQWYSMIKRIQFNWLDVWLLGVTVRYECLLGATIINDLPLAKLSLKLKSYISMYNIKGWQSKIKKSSNVWFKTIHRPKNLT